MTLATARTPKIQSAFTTALIVLITQGARTVISIRPCHFTRSIPDNEPVKPIKLRGKNV